MAVTKSQAPDDNAAPDLFASVRLLYRFGRNVSLILLASALLASCAALLELFPVWIVWKLISELIAGEAGTGRFTEFALLALTAIVAGYLLTGLANALAHTAAFRLIHALRLKLALHLSRLPLGWFADRRSGEAKSLIVDEPERLEGFVAHGVPEGISAVATWLVVTIWLFAADWRMAIASTLLPPVAFGFMIVASRRASRMIGSYQEAAGNLNGAIVEYLAGMPVVKIFNRTGDRLSATAEAVNDYAAIETRLSRQFVPFGAVFYTLIAANICVILPAGMFFVGQGSLDLPTFVLFVIVGANYSQPLLRLFNLFHEMAHISMASTLLDRVLQTPEQQNTGRRIPLKRHEIIFDRVSFGYGAHDVLHDVRFTAPEGKVTALVGPSGAGKSTVAELILRLREPRTGRILIGGVDIRDIALEQLMDEIAFVFQDSFLFSGTIAENIRLGQAGATISEVQHAARSACAHDFIMALPDGYDSLLGAGGVTLSGGERQRIAIARAILKNAPVIVLDEATAFADPDNEAAIQDALSELTKGRTVIVVAHRLHTIQKADRIIVLDRGQVIDAGQHEALVARGGLYAQLWSDYMTARAISPRGGGTTEMMQ